MIFLLYICNLKHRKPRPYFIYEGLYDVIDVIQEEINGFNVIKFKLKAVEGESIVSTKVSNKIRVGSIRSRPVKKRIITVKIIKRIQHMNIMSIIGYKEK